MKISAAPAARMRSTSSCDSAGSMSPRVARCQLPAVGARVVDVHVEPVLMARVADVAEAGAEVAAVRAAEVAGQEALREWMRRVEVARDGQDGAHEPVRAPAAPGAVRERRSTGSQVKKVWPAAGSRTP